MILYKKPCKPTKFSSIVENKSKYAPPVAVYIKLAWRNLFRNKRRTLLSVLAIGVGIAALIFVDALLIGWKDNMIHTATATFMGQGQVHHKGFLETLEVDKTIDHPGKKINKLKSNPDIQQITCRTRSFGMIASPGNVQSIIINGIDPETEKNMSKLDEAIIKGNFSGKNNGHNKMLIGKKLAEILEVTPGDKVTLTVAQAKTGNTAQEMFRIGGIFEFKVREMDTSMAFIDLHQSQKLLGINKDVHEIAFTFKDITLSTQVNHPVWSLLGYSDIETLSWLELMPELKAMLSWLNVSMLIMTIILFGIVAAGIVNTLFMSLYERMFEFGVLRAVGTRPGNLAFLIVLEAGSLAVISAVAGSVMGAILVYIFSKEGLDYSDTEFVNVAIIDRIYPVMASHQFMIYPLSLILFTMVIGLYPAIHAAKITPAKAMKK
ncbi:ABC-type transport system, involved in lipoprotein release, permease component [Desulfocicer vacuolatum DSM 3385]|uniref:ABC-type transport system, involved in lipoprotein release, permease component n=2 Tax=Desulfocicer vacuolatum TaxID=2298 RepID=A0A1W2A3C3_9BACT|nr:ABC-type transport system, involved in lipoprotein release, permease component [Desulfocicer vacuolatum DSM 3385]